MKRIEKGKEPEELVFFKKQVNADFESLPTQLKDELRRKLLEEQGHICCYCMGRITFENSKIEHFKPQSKYPKEALNYKNLFLACKGGEGEDEQHCDSSKKDQELEAVDLLRKDFPIEKRVKYRERKKEMAVLITSDEPQLQNEIDSILNLNCEKLKRNRYQKWNEVKERIKKQGFKVQVLKKTIRFYQSRQKDRKYAPFCQMIIFFLERKLGKKGIKML